MKKMVAFWLCISMVFFLAACGKKADIPAQSSFKTEEIGESEAETISQPEEEQKPAESVQTEAQTPEESMVSQVQTEQDKTSDAAWRTFLKEYEAWVDTYIAVLEKYEKNPSDMSILSDYLEMLEQLESWTEQSEAMEAELEESEALVEYSLELLRITEKLAKATY